VLREAARLAPDRAGPQLLLGQALAAVGDREGAIARYAAGLGRAPDDADAHYELGVLLNGAGRKAQAEQELGRALALAPGHPRANAVMCKRSARRGDFADAIRRCDVASAAGIRLSPELVALLAPHRAAPARSPAPRAPTASAPRPP
jgi:Flp pilus assembly protein TadD